MEREEIRKRISELKAQGKIVPPMSLIKTPEQIEALKNLGNKNLQAAQIFLGMLPITLVYPFLQKYFIKGITIGSVKG